MAGSLAAPTSAWAADPIVNQAPPSLTAPADETSTPVKDVILQWTSVPYATSYEVEVSPNGDFTNNNIELPNKGITVATRMELPVSLPHDEYYWRVRGVDANGTTAWSTTRQFLHDWAVQMTILRTPTSSDPTISWAPVPEASLYRVRYSDSPGFETPDTHACYTANTSFSPYDLDVQSTEDIPEQDCFQPAAPKAGTAYYYEVVAYDDSTADIIQAQNSNDPSWECEQAQPECDALTVGPVSNVPFTYQTSAGGTPTGSTVTGLATRWHTTSLPGTACDATTPCPTTPTFSWDPVPGAAMYHVHVFRDPYLTNTYRAYNTPWPSLTPRENYQDAQAGRAYYWTVSARDDQNRTFAFSSVSEFVKKSAAPAQQTPAEGATLGGKAVTYQWADFLPGPGSGALEARNFHVEVASDPSFTDPLVLDEDSIDMTSWTDQKELLKDGVYYWRVQAIDESGNHLTWSATRTFTVDAAPPSFRITNKDGVGVTHNLHIKASERDINGTVSQKTLHVVEVSSGDTVDGAWSKTGADTWTFDPKGVLIPGESYTLRVVGGLHDQVGNAATASNKAVRTSTEVDDRSPAIDYTGKWSQHTSSNAVAGTYSATSGKGDATVTVVGSKVRVIGCKGPDFGRLAIGIYAGGGGGAQLSTVNLHQQFTECGVLLWKHPISSSVQHTLEFAAQKGTIAIDAVKLG